MLVHDLRNHLFPRLPSSITAACSSLRKEFFQAGVFPMDLRKGLPRGDCEFVTNDSPTINRQKVAGTPKGFRNTARGCAAGATPGRRIFLKISPVRAAQTPGMAGFCAILSGLSPAGVPTRGRREMHQPRAVFRSPIRAFPNVNPQMWDFLPGHHQW